MKVAFATLGCRVNVYESEAMAEKFIREGYEVVDFNEFSDVYVINTCTVTNMGDKKSRQIISRARRTNPCNNSSSWLLFSNGTKRGFGNTRSRCSFRYKK